MSSSIWNRVLDSPKQDHFVQFYGSDEGLLVRNVSKYLTAGLKNGEAAIVIATPEHIQAFTQGLESHIAAGRFACLDACATFPRFLVSGVPVWELFLQAIVPEIQRIREGASGLRAYGEMVGLLWNAGQRSAALRVEQFWNRLLSRSSFNLFCGYAIDIFDPGFDPSSIDALLSSHTHIVPGDCSRLEDGLRQAMKEVLGTRAEDAEAAMKQQKFGARWGILPRSEALILWLRRNAAGAAGEILSRARAYARAAAA